MKDKLNILIVHNYYKENGGEGIVVENEKNMLENEGHKVFLYTKNNNEIENYSLLDKILMPINYLFNIRTYIDINKIIKNNKIDIVHVHNTIVIISKSVYFAAKKNNIPIVQTIHNFRFMCPNGLFYRDGKICEDCLEKGLYNSIKHNCYRNSKLETLLSVINIVQLRRTNILQKINFICLTDFNKNKLIEINSRYNKQIISNDRVYVKPNFANKYDIFVPEKFRKKQIVFAGRLDSYKGIELLIEAWKYIDNYQLIICGTGEKEEWCKEYILKNNLKNIKLLGLVEHSETIKIISNSSALIIPSLWYEGFPMVIVEAFSTGTPVIAMNQGNAGNLITEGYNGCKYNKPNIKDIIEAVDRLEKYDNLYENSLLEFQTKYTCEINYQTLISIYFNSIKNNNS